MGDIKKEAKAGRVDTAKIMAKDLVRTRGYIKKMFQMKSHMEAISLRLQTMQSSMQMAQCMKGVTKVMGMKEDMMADAVDDAFADDEDEDAEDEILGSVLA